MLEDFEEYIEDITVQVYETSTAGVGGVEELVSSDVVKAAVFPLSGQDYTVLLGGSIKSGSYKIYTNYDIPSNGTKDKLETRVNIIYQNKDYNKKIEKVYPGEQMRTYIIEGVE